MYGFMSECTDKKLWRHMLVINLLKPLTDDTYYIYCREGGDFWGIVEVFSRLVSDGDTLFSGDNWGCGR